MRNKQNGIVLLDVLIATVVLSVALVAIAVMFTNSTKNTAEAWQNTVATNIAAEQMNRIKTFTSAQWATVEGVIEWQGGDDDSGVTIGGTVYTITTTVHAPTETGSTGLAEVRTTVAWKTLDNQRRQIMLTGFYKLN